MKTDFTIPLPVTDNAEIDWEYMDNYMRSIENKVKRNIEYLMNAI